jgi:hypothetical protein
LPFFSFSHFQKQGHQVTCVLTISKTGRPVALAYAVHPNCAAVEYADFFRILLKLGVSPATVMSDFEQALANAIAEVWPNARQRKCLFHLKQTTERWMQREFGYATASSWWPKIERAISQMATSLTQEQFERGLTDICGTCNGSSKGKQFLQYFLDYFIKRFPPTQWAACFAQDATERSHRTNNICESNNRVIHTLCPSGKLSLADGCAKLGQILQMQQLESAEEAEKLSPLREVVNATDALALFRGVMQSERDVVQRNEVVVSVPASSRQRELQRQRVEDELQQRALQLGPERTEVAGECFFQVVVDSGAAPPNATAASERVDLVHYANNLNQSLIDQIQPFLEEDFHTWLVKLSYRTTYVDHIAIQLWVDMAQQPLEIIRDDGAVVHIRPAEEGAEREPISILQQVRDEHFRALVPRDYPALPRQREIRLPPPSPSENRPTQLQILRQAENLAVSLRKERAAEKTKEKKTPCIATQKRREREARDDQEEAERLAADMRRGIEPEQPSVDGELRGNRLKKARADAERRRSVIARAREMATATPTRPSPVHREPPVERPTPQQLLPLTEPNNEEAQPPMERGLLGQLVELLVQQRLQNHSGAENVPQLPPTPESHEPAPTSPFPVVPAPQGISQQPTHRRGRPRRAEEGPTVRCSSCGHTNQTRPAGAQEWVQCALCTRNFHRRCVAKWLDDENPEFECKSCKPRPRNKK